MEADYHPPPSASFDDEAYPNFGAAYPSSTTQPAGTASWNPALRRDSEAEPIPPRIAGNEEEDDDFFARYPGATPKKTQVDGNTRELGASPLRRQSISVQSVVEVSGAEATEEELRRVPSSSVQVEGPVRGLGFEEDEDNEEEGEEEDEARVLREDDTVAEQRSALDEEMLGVESAPQDEEDATDTPEEIISPSSHYEHQSEATIMEEALEPSADVSLLEDEEPLPTPGYMSREPTFSMPADEEGDALGFDGEAAPKVQPSLKSNLPPPTLDRSFTTNFLDSPVERPSQALEQHERSIPEDWPSAGDDRTFGELLDNENVAAPAVQSHDTTTDAVLDDSDDGLLLDDDGDIPTEDLAAAWGAAIDDDELLDETPTTATGDFDPSAVFGDDDGGFLQDELVPAPVQEQQRQAPYTPTASQDQMFGSHGRSAGTPSTGLFDVYNAQGAVQQPQGQAPRPAMPPPTQSFVDKAKGGYQSPYDLPMDVVKPRRRPQQPPQQQSQQQVSSPPPPVGPSPAFSNQRPAMAPPRSSSINSVSSAALGQVRPRGPSQTMTGSVGSLSPPTSSHGSQSQPSLPKPTSTPKSSSGFFEELPMTVKPRHRPGGTFTPVQNMGIPTPPPSMGMGQVPSLPPSRSVTGDSLAGMTPQQFQQEQQQQMFAGLRKPDQMPLLPAQPRSQLPPTQAQVAPAQGMRYTPPSQQQPGSALPTPAAPAAPAGRFSPAPPPAAASTGRYSPAPAAAPASKQRNPSFPFAPRTSSPLAGIAVPPQPPFPASPPRTNGVNQTTMSLSPERPGSRYTPLETPQQQMHQPPHPAQPPMTFAPPMNRPRTQSPDTTMKGPRAAMAQAMNTARPSSSSAGTTPAPAPYAMAQQPYQQQQQQNPIQVSGAKRPALAHRRQFSRDLSFAPPADSRSQDPLQRWKGHPIFHWSPSGTVISTFPKHTPFYSAGQGLPSVKCTPGPITVQDVAAFMPMDEASAKFPGPLTARRKGGKKDVLAWMTVRIEGLEREVESARMRFEEGGEQARKRGVEKVMLWKVVRIFVENDGVLEGSGKIDEEVRRVLLPDLEQMAAVADLQSPASASAGAPEAVEKQVLFQIRQALLEGKRERAVWLAEEKRLWGHAMLIASTMGPETWKSVSASFVRSQVKSVGSDARSTAAVYQVFAGNAEECVDELVPPSARAGFRMISKADGSISGNPLEGLDQWRETLGLITSNRTANDGASLLALGKLLAGYGRAEAAHTCFLFARHLAKLSGADDTDTHIVLLGANHTPDDSPPLGSDLDTILLTEIYEYAASLSAPTTTPAYLPHLQPYKLLHAQRLAACGLKAAAQSYADAITVAYTSTTRPSGYYHPAFTSAVSEFAAFLAQTPHGDGKGSLFSRPAMKTVSSGAASWFSKFVAGEEDTGSEGSGAAGEAGVGPFGRVSGESPDLSRSGSGTELFGAAMLGGGVPIPGSQLASPPAFAPSSAPSRYAPGGAAQQITAGGGSKYAPGQVYSGMGFPAAEPQRPSSGYARYAPAPGSSSLGVPQSGLVRRASDQSLPYAPSSRRGSAQDTSSQGSYEPRPLLADADTGSMYSYSPAVQSPLVQAQQAHEDTPPPLDVVANGIQPPLLQDPEDGSVDAESGGYEPPSSGGYEPPSYSSTYQPYEPEPDSPEAPRSKPRKTYGDDDDFSTSTTSLKPQPKSTTSSREPDAAFLAAAEADAARDKASSSSDPKKGWLTGWFGGKKDPSLAAPGPIKAKLGEENSFYYDEQLKKWVNKKAGAEAAVANTPTPPPPQRAPGPPSRASSGMGPPSGGRPPTSGSGPAFGGGSGPPSRTGTPGSDGVNGDAGAAGPPMPFSAAPPLRPGSSLSTASSIDDLLAGPRKGGTVKGKKRGGRYVDVMAK